ncbi:MAG TPA: hypothetical protein VGW35_09460 [Methylomirabilota bacterium]|jgi:ABC-type nitrate/sulfonate/bicarbonate transport system substrate-binding protein|nr:hypothetical protein [Methylomirabilota bacterium]
MESRATRGGRRLAAVLIGLAILGTADGTPQAQTPVRIGYLPLLYYNAWHYADLQGWWAEIGLMGLEGFEALPKELSGWMLERCRLPRPGRA